MLFLIVFKANVFCSSKNKHRKFSSHLKPGKEQEGAAHTVRVPPGADDWRHTHLGH